MAETELDENQIGGAGRDALAGYDFQMDVSVWLALYFLVANKQAQELILEPASQEDLEGVLEEAEPSPVTSEIRLKAYKLIGHPACLNQQLSQFDEQWFSIAKVTVNHRLQECATAQPLEGKRVAKGRS